MSVRFMLLSLVLFMMAAAARCDEPEAKPRLIVLTDIGGDPDDQQAMIRLMLYSNEFEIEGLIASAAGTVKELGVDIIKPELIREIVEAYGKVRPSLVCHREAYPPVEYLLERVKQGNPHRGMANLGEGKDTEGSNWIIKVVDEDDSRLVNISIWGGSTELAQALWRVRHDRTKEELKEFQAKIRVYFIGHQDDTGPWINENFPELFCILGKEPEGTDKRTAVFRGMYLGGDETLTSRAWIDTNVRKGHGPLGALYPTKTWTAPNPHGTLKEGDSPSWFYFLPNGPGDAAQPGWGGWGGRFRNAGGTLWRDAQDTVDGKTEARASVSRWRPAFQSDFQARMDWCVKGPEEANHAPVAVLNGDAGRGAVTIKAKAGERVSLSAAGSSDPDGDSVQYRWWVYQEAGGNAGDVKVEDGAGERTAVSVPADAGGKEIHVILEVRDGGEPALTGYRRAVIQIGMTKGK